MKITELKNIAKEINENIKIELISTHSGCKKYAAKNNDIVIYEFIIKSNKGITQIAFSELIEAMEATTKEEAPKVESFDTFEMVDLKNELKEEIKIYADEYELSSAEDDNAKDEIRSEMLSDLLDTFIVKRDNFELLRVLQNNGDIDITAPNEWGGELVAELYELIYNERIEEASAEEVEDEEWEVLQDENSADIDNEFCYYDDIINNARRYYTPEIGALIVDYLAPALDELLYQLCEELEK